MHTYEIPCPRFNYESDFDNLTIYESDFDNLTILPHITIGFYINFLEEISYSRDGN